MKLFSKLYCNNVDNFLLSFYIYEWFKNKTRSANVDPKSIISKGAEICWRFSELSGLYQNKLHIMISKYTLYIILAFQTINLKIFRWINLLLTAVIYSWYFSMLFFRRQFHGWKLIRFPWIEAETVLLT